MIKLIVRLSGQTLETFNFSNQDITIGRDSKADITLDNPAISRLHAQVLREGEGFKIKDEGSANGTYLNGERVHEKTLQNGDTISVGKFQLLVGMGSDKVDKMAPVVDIMGGTLEMDASIVEKTRAAAREQEISQAAQESGIMPAPDKPEPVPSSSSLDRKPASGAATQQSSVQSQLLQTRLKKGTNHTPYVIVSLLIGIVIGFVIGMLVTKHVP